MTPVIILIQVFSCIFIIIFKQDFYNYLFKSSTTGTDLYPTPILSIPISIS